MTAATADAILSELFMTVSFSVLRRDLDVRWRNVLAPHQFRKCQMNIGFMRKPYEEGIATLRRARHQSLRVSRCDWK
jgi:hypothetical protein